MTEYISIKIKEFVYTEASNDFFWSVSVLCFTLSGIALYLKNYFFIPVLLIGSILVLVFAKQKPQDIELLINNEGFIYHSRKVPWSSFSSFWFDEDNEGNLRLILKKKAHQFDEFEVFHFNEEIDIDIIRELFASYEIIEEPLEEPIMHQILERFGY